MLSRTVSSAAARVARRQPVSTVPLTVRCSAAPMFSLSGVRIAASTQSTHSMQVKDFKRWASNSTDPAPNSFITKPLEGPISPHFTIYRFPLPGLTSGAHRGTGFALTLGTRNFFVSIAFDRRRASPASPSAIIS